MASLWPARRAAAAGTIGSDACAARSPRGLPWPTSFANVAETLKTDPRFAAEVCSTAYRLATPLPDVDVSYRTCSAVARRCTDLIVCFRPTTAGGTASQRVEGWTNSG